MPLTCVCNPCLKDPPIINNVSPAIYLSAVLGGLAVAYVAVRALCKVLDPSRMSVIDFDLDLLGIDAASPKFIGRSGLTPPSPKY